ncbi:glycoside hydrolase family 32 protein [Escherichia coli]|nr:glycoside hydrolase family 32 protein [Escherichia coli]MBM3033685.1 glycoside hydrolase family 32 protein [Escherichia coli]MBM3048998.1 glycoside hydrolase family 32 protein [Escherichia coli]MBM3058738.1 glycoside hydrolase family 32 protein [Escherichia coli]HCN8702464.1 glycoside hydrolase family 32 protein [Escherichia coli]
MMKQRLALAQSALEKLCARRGNAWYPIFHLAPPAGWMNDPNGLIYFNGRYHAFFQHHPASAYQGPMHWGHATSTDMLHWQHEPIALAPGDKYDRDGCFSGSAVDDDGVLSLIYTGHICLDDRGNDSIIREVQCLATSHDGIHFEKQGCVLTPPEGIMHFRDPKVWHEDGSWWMVIGARDASDNGQVLLYRGTSLRDWHLEHVLAHSAAGKSYMWECPDFFRCGNFHWLMFSPQGMPPSGYRFRNLFQSGVLAGSWKPGSVFALKGGFEELDYGHDFYAPQSMLAEDGRRIIMAWMNMWDSPVPTRSEAWAGCLTLPREVFERDGRLCQRPVREVESLRKKCQPLSPVKLQGLQLLTENVQAAELLVTWHTVDSHAEHYGVRLGDGLRLYVDNQAGRLVLWRYYPEEGLDGYRSVELPDTEYLTLRIFLDRSSVEVFVNDGEATLSSRIYPQADSRQLSLYAAHGDAILTDGTLWMLT